ncbi:type 1 glutamine amidotransferase [Niveibacterium terrae]|uniref:type 1 glutamine amidotransferase n=1 Tax=Niveibacterium terrae TaxID=3373598 RepID=UPI003A95995A
MRVHVLQHVPFEALGSIDAWLAARDARVSWTRIYESAALPALAEFDLLIVLGGPMSVHDGELHPWLADEEALIGEAVRAGKAVLGICLGAQLIASSLGAAVHRGTHKEIGFFAIEAVASTDAKAFRFPDSVEVFHWHGETFALPDGAVLLAKSTACAHQAFQFGPRAIALQFHLETTAASAALMLEHCADELIPGPFIQSAEAIRARPAARYAQINALMGEVLDYLVRP